MDVQAHNLEPAARTAARRNGWAAAARVLRARFWLAAFLVSAGVLVYPELRDLALSVEVTPAARGYRTALRSGCFDCHGPDGSGGVKNPGSKDGEVPGFGGGTPMMWAKSEAELRAYILDGAPARKRNDPRYRQQRRAQLLAMPAYRGYLSGGQVDDLLAYLRAVSGLLAPKDPVAAQGQDLAYRFGCFHCHGPMGAGTSRNPGSLKDYIPGWWGDDFRELVRSDGELRGWILDGDIPRLRNNPVAAYFVNRQRVSMPAYRNFLKPDQLKALMQYVRWVNSGVWRKQPLNLEQ